MIAEFGHFALISALCVCLVQVGVAFSGAASGASDLMRMGDNAARAQCGLVFIAFGALTYSFVVSDFSLAVVHANSHIAKPLVYKIAGVWGNHEGSMLLWVLILALYGAAFSVFERAMPQTLHARILAVQGLMGIAFLVFLLATSNPFSRLDLAPFEGRGLTPILQDPALAAHPPLLYAGYVGFSMTFSFAVAALLEGQVDRAWARWMRPWTLLAWVFLTLGIALGSYWAYYELGWGGFWFWDPVENASLMPWLAGTALLHSALVAERRGTLINWTLLLAIVTFALSLAGTFLVRSGVLTSVHAFANDPARGVFILAILALFTGGGLAVYGLRAPASSRDGFQPASREALLVTNNIFLATATVTVFVGTIYPLVLDAIGGPKISVGAPYFNAVFAPLTIPFLIMLPLGPMLAWRGDTFSSLFGRLAPAALAAVLVTCGLALTRSGTPLLALVLLGGAFWLVGGALTDMVERLRRLKNLAQTPLLSAPVAHAGLGVMIIGIIAATAWRQELVVAVAPGDQLRIAGQSLRFEGVRERAGPNFTSEQASLVYLDGPHEGADLRPERRFYEAERSQTTEAAITTDLTGHLYAVIGEPVDGKRVVRIWYHPFVALIWLGAVLMACGGALGLVGRVRLAGRMHQSGGAA
ncbi:MAG TPA: heme lyase NrfEFG subunit NrfE [Rhodobiaceae bacterium]|nr:heme lyase NrfEFG subunit NrfE [Rhodobiaceae bacterium]|tara:strand:- start:3170 stop:5098 length:1929 start_codon:yes stop_codon:yes gene_type:complete